MMKKDGRADSEAAQPAEGVNAGSDDEGEERRVEDPMPAVLVHHSTGRDEPFASGDDESRAPLCPLG